MGDETAPPAARMDDIIGPLPYRMAFAGGWIDQPFVSKHNPDPFGSMVVISIRNDCRFMDRCGMGTSTRKAALELWKGKLPEGDPLELMRVLYNAENGGKAEPSGSQDMAGLLFPGISRLDYSFESNGGVFPAHIENCTDPEIGEWLRSMVWLVPVAQRPAGYNPLAEKNLDPEQVRRLGRTGIGCYDAILAMDASKLGESMNDCMECWERILPGTVRHSSIDIDLKGILRWYQRRYHGAMYSGCGGGYLYVVSGEPVPGGFRVRIRLGKDGEKSEEGDG